MFQKLNPCTNSWRKIEQTQILFALQTKITHFWKFPYGYCWPLKLEKKLSLVVDDWLLRLEKKLSFVVVAIDVNPDPAPIGIALPM